MNISNELLEQRQDARKSIKLQKFLMVGNLAYWGVVSYLLGDFYRHSPQEATIPLAIVTPILYSAHTLLARSQQLDLDKSISKFNNEFNIKEELHKMFNQKVDPSEYAKNNQFSEKATEEFMREFPTIAIEEKLDQLFLNLLSKISPDTDEELNQPISIKNRKKRSN
jgi:hypothetical protein